jgi:ABC-type transporter Mla subunit MlaD
MRLSDRQLGLLTLLILFGVGLWVATLMVVKSNQATNRILSIFNELGSLQPEDPVTSRGYLIGKVGQVSWVDRKALVEILLDQPMVFREGTTLRNENYSLMGQRRIEITVSHKGRTIDPEYIFQGEFEPGIAEAMHVISQVREQVISVRDLVFLLRDGDSTTNSVPRTVELMLSKSETLVNQLERTLNVARPKIASTLSDVESLSNKTIQVSAETDTILRSINSQGRITIEQARNLTRSVEKSIDLLTVFLDHLESQPFSQELLEKKEIILQLTGFIQTLQDVLQIFNAKGGLVILDEKGNPRGITSLKNVNLIGNTAREKARIRLQELSK